MLKVERFALGEFTLVGGQKTTDCFLEYHALGDPTNPAVLKPTCFGGSIRSSDIPIGEEHTLTPEKYFIIQVGMLGGGESSSPSNSKAPYDGPRFPPITLADQVEAQKKLVESLGITKLWAVTGYSMGAMQSYQWAVQYPSFVQHIIPTSGAARCSLHNYVFLEGPKNALFADGKFNNGEYTPDDLPLLGLKGFARAYSGWGFSSAWYREHRYKELGFKDFDEYLVKYWDEGMGTLDANDLLSLVKTWQTGDVSNIPPYNGNLEAAMQAIEARALVMPCTTDQYFEAVTGEHEVSLMRPGIGKYNPIISIWGHQAGGCSNPVDNKFYDDSVAALFAETEAKLNA
ncbi:homoserine acetyltransferase family protein [Dacryopinax primogenitus]|uniref:Homoserine acetyltransferase family protein n=1 Tax=Dacryopinax primogenitus (strain DJM 731) TaxID=1858805 RepID=M5GG69_DACPD|nr:homoserine acetyltransferase family protein [Dacryopinax primogenitus]EJU04968.1 homoserine acetyltransferase family protein [Dacryopinax primogenitus]